ncbi:BRO-N domain-containing protein [Labrys neptuniae]
MTTKTFDFTALNGAQTITTKLRVIDLKGKPWFVLGEVCRAIGYALKADGKVNSSLAAKPLAAEEKGTCRISTPGGLQPSLIISESGLYKLIMRSDKPVARQFQDWVTRTVLPSIRQDGAYITGEEKVATGEMTEDELILKAVGILQAKVERLSAENAVMKSELNILSVDEYRALMHAYWDQSFKSRLSTLAKKLSLEAGVPIQKQDRKLPIRGKVIDTQVNVYRREFLEAAFKKLKA